MGVKEFVDRWSGYHNEEREARSFILELLEILGVEEPTKAVEFEKQVKVKRRISAAFRGKRRPSEVTTKKIDAYIPDTKVLIEMKSGDVDLDCLPAGSEYSSAFEQAKSYYDNLKMSERGRWIVTSNFYELRLYDMENPTEKPIVLQLNQLTDNGIHALDILIDKIYTDPQARRIHKEQQLSIKAGELVGELYKLLLGRLHDPTKDQMKDLNILIVRLVFCFYAEDADLFSPHQFHDYLKQFRPERMNRALSELFLVLNTPEADRNTDYLDDDLLNFPYVNGGLFSQEIKIPVFTPEIVNYILEYCSEGFDWSGISPTIFGALFESTLNPEARRSGGMHYTSVENIHKLIDPLFLDDLKAELDTIKDIRRESTRRQAVYAFQQKLSNLTFFDPACGSGNFLTESYLSLRRLENEALKCDSDGAQRMGDDVIIMVSIQQFYGVEINDFAVAVATTALYIAEAQMYKETKKFLPYQDTFLPLRSYTNIHEGNALRMNWNDVVSPSKLSYILGNPPFLGATWQSKEQKSDLMSVYLDNQGKPYRMGGCVVGRIDYVAGWYYKACEMMEHNKKIEAAFVSTNSICQGMQTALVWYPLKDMFNIHINFAYTSFVWSSEATEMARVHVIIIGFSLQKKKSPVIYRGREKVKVAEIGPYLTESGWYFVQGRSKPIGEVPPMVRGNQPTDNGYLIINTKEEADSFKNKYPDLSKYIRPFMMGVDFIKRKPRYCFWLIDALPNEIRKSKELLNRIEKVKEYRLVSGKKATQRKAMTPQLFDEIKENPVSGKYLAFPKVTSERREYIPIDFLDFEVIPGDKLFFIDSDSLYLFGILTSSVHMAWTRLTAGRLKSDYSYSNTVVYNNYPWPNLTDKQKAKIEKTAQTILDVRALYQNCSLADLYDPLTMPVELRKAHEANDRAVKEAYGFRRSITEPEIISELMKRYQDLVKDNE